MNYFYKKRMRSFLLKYSKKNDGGIVRFSKSKSKLRIMEILEMKTQFSAKKKKPNSTPK